MEEKKQLGEIGDLCNFLQFEIRPNSRIFSRKTLVSRSLGVREKKCFLQL